MQLGDMFLKPLLIYVFSSSLLFFPCNLFVEKPKSFSLNFPTIRFCWLYLCGVTYHSPPTCISCKLVDIRMTWFTFNFSPRILEGNAVWFYVLFLKVGSLSSVLLDWESVSSVASLIQSSLNFPTAFHLKALAVTDDSLPRSRSSLGIPKWW